MSGLRHIWPLLLPIVLWHLAATLDLLPFYILPAPIDVIEALISERDLLWSNMLVTLGEVFVGILIGAVLGCTTAILMSVSPTTRRLIKPSLVASQAIPVFVLAPVLTIWLGYGPEPKVAMTVLLVFFPIASGFLDGLMSTPQEVLDLSRITRAGRWREFFWLRLPHALGHLGAGFRIAVTYAPTGAVIGEWVGASEGLGYLMLMSNARMRIDLMFAALLLIIAMTVLLNLSVNQLLRRFRL